MPIQHYMLYLFFCIRMLVKKFIKVYSTRGKINCSVSSLWNSDYIYYRPKSSTGCWQTRVQTQFCFITTCVTLPTDQLGLQVKWVPFSEVRAVSGEGRRGNVRVSFGHYLQKTCLTATRARGEMTGGEGQWGQFKKSEHHFPKLATIFCTIQIFVQNMPLGICLLWI